MNTRTVVELPVSKAAYEEIRRKLENAEYLIYPSEKVLDMTGIALVPEKEGTAR